MTLTSGGQLYTNILRATTVMQLDSVTSYPGSNGSIYREGSDVKIFTGGSEVNMTTLAAGGSGSGATTELDNLGTTAINAHLLFDAAGTYDIGDSTNYLDDLFTEHIRFPANGAGLTNSHGMYRQLLSSTDSTVINVPTNTDFYIRENGANNLLLIDTSANVFRIAGGILSLILNNGTDEWSVTKTASGSAKYAASGDRHSFDNTIQPTIGDAYDLGLTTHKWDNLYLNGDIVLESGFKTSKLFFDNGGDTYITGSGVSGRINIFNDDDNVTNFTTSGISTDTIQILGAINHDGSTVGFYSATPITKQTGVAVTASGIHAALVSLGLIT